MGIVDFLKNRKRKKEFGAIVSEINKTLYPDKDKLSEVFPKGDGADILFYRYIDAEEYFTSMKSEKEVISAFIEYSLKFDELKLGLMLLPELKSLILADHPGLLNDDELTVLAAHIQLTGTTNEIKNVADL